MSDGFRVDVGALRHASDGIDGVLQDVRAENVTAIDPGVTAFGHTRLASSLAGFCDRWQLGVDNLATDGQEIAGRLRVSMNAYEQFERAAKQRLDSILQGTGPDPGAP